jgi:formate C-acetyltransferase
MGIATFADSLAAVEEVVFNQGYTDLPGLLKALAADFAGYDLLRARLLQAPKYGNNIDLVDKYAVWYVELMSELFAPYKTRDGGGVYVAIASNVNNIPAGREIAATPDGRRSGQPLSDAASPMRGADRKGPTSAILSVAKPDYTLAACGTVLNQKFTSQMLQDPAKRARVQALVRTYFARGGQEIQINSVSREDLLAAMEKPDEYLDLVVRVSGFSAYFVKLDKAVQLDILSRTEHA